MTTRRSFIRYLCIAAAIGARRATPANNSRSRNAEPLSFEEIPHGIGATHHLSPGYIAEILLRWGDPVTGNSPPWSPTDLSEKTQRTQFGYNNDFIAFMPLPLGSAKSDHGLLCVNHEFTNTTFMWPNLSSISLNNSMTMERTGVEMAAIGHSVVEIQMDNGRWHAKQGSFNRRLTADSRIRLSGPAATHERMRTTADPEGHSCLGVLNPCGGGKTPWGTVLIAEENFNLLFTGHTREVQERRNHKRYGVGSRPTYSWWARNFERFHVERHPNEPNRFGWIIEFDPYAPNSLPIKRTALGRLKHEAANCTLSRDGRVVVYLGDDEAFEYLYKFVSCDRFNPNDRDANMGLLDKGTLYVARFYDGGNLEWVPLRFGDGLLTSANGFHDEADILIETRRAADLVGATKLDRPEDVEANPHDGSVYTILTNNHFRHADSLDAANPRSHNDFGHILKLYPPGSPGKMVDHASTEFAWEIFVLAGDPTNAAHSAQYPGHLSKHGWFASPDNCAFDPSGRLWIATDQGRDWRKTGFADGLWACGTDTNGQTTIKRFFRAPVGAEVCGPEFTPDGRTLFLAVQHPGVDGINGASYENPGTRWPDFKEGTPPRPSVVAITRRDGGEIGI